MKFWPTKIQWNKWSLPSKATYVSMVIAVPSFLITVGAFVIGLINSGVPPVNNPPINDIESARLSFLPGDIIFLKKGNPKKTLEIEILVERISGTAVLKRKAEILSQDISDTYLFRSKESFDEDLYNPNIKLLNVKLQTTVLNETKKKTKIILELKPQFINFDYAYNWIVEKEKFGEITIRIFYVSNKKEQYSDVVIPMFFM